MYNNCIIVIIQASAKFDFAPFQIFVFIQQYSVFDSFYRIWCVESKCQVNVYNIWIETENKTTIIRYLRKTFISLSSESSLPFNAFLSIIFTAYISFGRSLLTAKRTSEKAPLWTQNQQLIKIYME